MAFPELDPLIHQPTRLRIIAFVHRNRDVPATWVREELGLTFGNLASHAAKLEEAGYLRQRKALTPHGFQARLTITAEGDAAFRRYVDTLRRYLDREEGALIDADGRRNA